MFDYGKSVRAYILDTGIYAAHQEFSNGIVDAGYDATTSDGTPSNPCPNVKGSSPIYASHGTWVASVLAGHTVGAGKHTRLVPVRVFNCDGTGTSDMMYSGLSWISANGVLPAVINLSVWWTPESPTLHNSLIGLENAGYVIFVSANNYPLDSACNRAPAKYARSQNGPVITVGGTMIGSSGNGINVGEWIDYRWKYDADHDGLLEVDEGSSFGACVDIWAPAMNIKVADFRDLNGNSVADDFRVLSGTSFSSPIAAGVAARRLVISPGSTPDDVWSWMQTNATQHDSSGSTWLVRDVSTTPHGRMLHFLDSCRSRL